jgi:3-deoxy-manno-octulosonate cytidylyltransferase (CMP-KDO synthetase)
MKVVAVIPVRMGSSRFPGKPLAKLLGRPMVEHVYRRVAMCTTLQGVYVATCDEEIRNAAQAFGCSVIMTSSAHERASDRVAEAAEHLDADVVVLVQGDEPMTTPEMITLAVGPMQQEPEVQCVNLTTRILSEDEMRDPNTIKVVMDRRGDALYFSREPVPTIRSVGFARVPAFKQVCIIPFRRGLLLRYASLLPTPLELAESIDMLRLLEHGYKVRLVETDQRTHAVDTPADLALVESLMGDDRLLARYA